MNRYNVDTVSAPYLRRAGYQRAEDALINLHYLGIDNVLVYAATPPKMKNAFLPEPGGHKYASELLKQVVDLNKGVYLEQDLKNSSQTKFCIGVAGYPENTSRHQIWKATAPT